jgi:predicted phage baseplate assembly protein
MWILSFDRAPTPFTRADFDEAKPMITVYGNLADATQGKAENEVPLGNGDARARFQTFKIPKTPLTYLHSMGATPPQAPELDVRVNGRLWQRVPSLYGRAASDEVYIVREDADGSSYVQFGDGETGARLPSGIQNVRASYRSGNGAHGPLKPGAAPSAGRRIEGVDKVQLPGLVTGGADPEAGDRARAAAPGKVQSLGRLVSLRDFETEVLTIPGVTTASAAWGISGGVPTLALRVLLEAGRETEFAAVRATIQSYQRCRGPDRFPVSVLPSFLRYVFLDLQYAFDARRTKDEIELAIRADLGLMGDEANARTGLFGLHARRLAAREYATRIEGRVQLVSGVTWCRVVALGLLPALITEPVTTPLPAAPRARAETLEPSDNELLQLHAAHLTLATAPATAPGECA